MTLKHLTALGIATAFLLAPVTSLGAEKAKTKLKPYPLETCVVSGEELGGMGEPFVFDHKGQEIKLCCKSCKKDFDKDSAKFMAKVDAAAKKVKPYKLDTCPVSGEKLGDDAPALVYKGQEVKFCCKDCVKSFNKEPAKYTGKITGAAK